LNYHEQWTPVETKSYFVEGNVGHDLLMIYYKNIVMTDHDSCVRLVKQKVAQFHAAAGQDPDKLKIVATMARVVKGYLEDFARHEDQKWEFLDAEKEFEIPLKTPKGREFLLEGRIDIVAKERATNRVWAWDHKFIGKKPWWSEAQLLMDSQMPTYVAALQSMGVPIFGALVNQCNKYQYAKTQDMVEENLYKRSPIYHTNDELAARLNNFGMMVDELLECNEQGIFRRSLKRDCSDCFWQDPCLMSLKVPDAPVSDFLQVNFTKKAPKRALI
jgi:hypothetical protein